MSARDPLPKGMSGGDLLYALTYISYATQRDDGMAHSSAVRLFGLSAEIAAEYAEKYAEQCEPPEWDADTRSAHAEMMEAVEGARHE